MSWTVAENSKAGICFLTGLSVLAELSYDTLVVNRGGGLRTHQGQTRLTTPCLLHSALPRNSHISSYMCEFSFSPDVICFMHFR